MRLPNKFKSSILMSSIVLALSACGGADTATDAPVASVVDNGDTPQKYSSIYSTKAVDGSVTSTCGTPGGIEIYSGFDANENKVLDESEIDKTMVVCNGADGADASTTSTSAISALTIPTSSTSDCAGVGGTKLTVNGSDFLLCNVNSAVVPAHNYTEARAMVNGLGTWVNTLSNLPTHLASLDDEADTLSALYGDGTSNAEGVGQTISALGVTASLMALVGNDTMIDGSYTLSEIKTANIDETADLDTVNGTGTITKTSGVLTLSSDFSLSSTLNSVTNTVTLSMDPVTLPATSGTRFNLSITHAVVKSNYATMTIPSLVGAVTTQNSIDLNSDEEIVSGTVSIAFSLGSQAAPATFTTLVKNTDGSATVPIILEGYIEIDANNILETVDSGRVAFGGQLAYGGKSVAVDAALDVTQLNNETGVVTDTYDDGSQYSYEEALRPTFDHHDEYTFSATTDVKGFSLTNGDTMPALSLGVEAQRWGVVGRSGDMTFTISYDENTFEAKYKHYTVFEEYYNQNSDGSFNYDSGRGEPLSFVFTDNLGGKVVMEDFREEASTTLLNCNDYSSSAYNGANADAACALGTRKFHIYYNGLDHGYIYSDYGTGDWIATYYDGVEERIYKY